MSRWLRKLNPEQRRAVKTVEGPLLVLAGAGSGKTRVITHRIAYLLEQGVSAEAILGVTFTNKAAEEMQQRLLGMVGQPAEQVTLSTFHSLGLRMLKSERQRGRRRARFTVFDASDQLAVLRELTRRMRFERSFDLGSVLSRISDLKNAFVDPQAVEYSEEDPYAEAAALLYPAYQEQLEAYAAVDFDDLVCVPTQMMERSAACRARWSERFRYVLVDEYQDTNGAQLRMLRALAGEHRNLCVVGDDDQAIYGWRGADVQNILRFAEHFEGAKVIYLMRNYRSVSRVLDVANAVIAENPERHPKQLVPTRDAGPRVRLLVAPDDEAELGWVARRIRAALDTGSRRPHDIAVLYRSNLLSRALETELRQHGVPTRVLGGTALFDRRDVKDVIAYLRVCLNPSDEVSLRRVINSPPRGIGTKSVARLAAYAGEHDKSLYWALGRAEQALPSGDRAVGPIRDFAALISRTRETLKSGPRMGAATRSLLDSIDLRGLVERTSPSGKVLMRRWESVEALVAGIERFAQNNPNPSLATYLARVALTSSDDDVRSEAGVDAVTLSTLHGSKGLEFPVVFLMGAEEGLLPHDRTLNPHEHDHVSGDINEERRLCYVGITRAMDELVITRTIERTIRGRRQERTPSRFLEAIPEEWLELEDLSEPPPMEDVKAMMSDLRAMLGG